LIRLIDVCKYASVDTRLFALFDCIHKYLFDSWGILNDMNINSFSHAGGVEGFRSVPCLVQLIDLLTRH